jgi:endonuclease VIII
VLWNGAILELLGGRPAPTLGPDILAEPPDYETMLARLRAASQEREIGDALLDQRLVAGIGNLWRAEALWEARISPWRRLDELDDPEIVATLEVSRRSMRAAVRSAPQGEHARTAYWCSGCQVGGNAPLS